METPAPEIVHCRGLDAASAAIIPVVRRRMLQAIDRQGYGAMAISGGGTPARLFEALSHSELTRNLPWRKIFIFFVDERVVAPGHPESNYAMFQEHFAAHLPLPESQVFRMPVEITPAALAAARYQRSMREFFFTRTGKGEPDGENQYPAFDLILLGMGRDGHTASLFPSHPALGRMEWVVAVEAELAAPPVPRLTLTLPVINQADTVIFLISGEEKIRLAESFQQKAAQPGYPASLVRPQRRLLWYMAH